jgi:hypothetical protein
MDNVCVPLLAQPNGTGCTRPTDCESGYCVDKVCCENGCTGPCMACSNAKTGQEDGTCRPIAAGTDPDNECQTPLEDVCNAGTCQCNNGVKDGAELKVDCGGACGPCAGKWVCDGSPVCDGAKNLTCCGPFCPGCVNTASFCVMQHGANCVVGQDQPKTFPLELISTPECVAKGSGTCVFASCKCE